MISYVQYYTLLALERRPGKTQKYCKSSQKRCFSTLRMKGRLVQLIRSSSKPEENKKWQELLNTQEVQVNLRLINCIRSVPLFRQEFTYKKAVLKSKQSLCIGQWNYTGHCGYITFSEQMLLNDLICTS